MSQFEVVRMPREELDATLAWAAQEGWNPGLQDADCFWAIDPDGFFMGVLDGRVIGRAAALIYDECFAFCGFYIVHPDFRGKGYGLEITKARLDYIGDRNAGLDGVVEMADKYKRLGYRFAHRSIRYAHTPIEKKVEDKHIVPASHIPFEQLTAYDRKHFFAPREAFLRRWIAQPDSRALGLLDDGVLKGYGVIRKCATGHKIGPLFADNAEVADALFDALCNHGLNEPVFIDVPEPNAAGMALAKRYGMQSKFECARMYLKGDPGLPLENVYGITTFEAG